jgi:hypothetical protein
MERRHRARLALALAAASALLACTPESSVTPARTTPLVPNARTSALDPSKGDLVMEGLRNPRGLAWGPEGALYVAEAGRGGPLHPGPCFESGGTVCYGLTGSVSRLWNGEQTRVVDSLPSYAQVTSGRAEGPNGISLHGLGGAYVSIGLETDPSTLRPQAPEWAQFARLVHLSPSALSPGSGKGRAGNSWEFVADLGQYEIDVNPDCGDIDSNPFGVLAEPGGVIVADAGANALVRRAANGELSTIAAFSNNTTIPGPGCPAGSSRDFVPTSIIVGPDGAYYIGHLNGLTILPGSSSVWRMERGGVPEVYRSGFTWIIGLAFDPTGNLYVLQHSVGPFTNSGGSLVRVTPDGTPTTVVGNIPRPGGIVVGEDGAVYVSMVPGTNFKGNGEVRRYVF